MVPNFSPPTLWYELWKTLVGIGLTLLYRTRYFGRENLPSRGPALVVCNHQSHLDPPLIGAGSPQQLYFMARKSLFANPLFGRFIRSIHAFPIDRDGAGVSGIKECLKLLKRGEMLVIFPEGTRCKNGEIQAFRPGFTTLAARTGAMIVPAAIDGAYRVWPRQRALPAAGRLYVRFGRPISAEEVRTLDEPALVRLVEQRVRDCLDELRRHPDLAGRKA